MDWLVLAVGEAAPFLSAPAVGCLSGAAPCSWEGPCASLQGAVWMGRHSKREGAVGVNAAAPQGPAPNRSRSCGCWSSCDDLSLKPSSIAGRNSSPSAPGSLPRALPPHVPFPRHPSCRVLGSAAQRMKTQKEKVGIPRGVAAGRAGLSSSGRMARQVPGRSPHSNKDAALWSRDAASHGQSRFRSLSWLRRQELEQLGS